MTRLQETALHEAGHAVCALLLGKDSAAKIFPDEPGVSGLAGSIAQDAPPLDPEEHSFEQLKDSWVGDSFSKLLDSATVTAAGATAVDLALGRYSWSVHGSDLVHIECMAQALKHGADNMVFQKLVELAVARARYLLSPVFFRVRAVADLLEQKHFLTADEIIVAFATARRVDECAPPSTDKLPVLL